MFYLIISRRKKEGYVLMDMKKFYGLADRIGEALSPFSFKQFNIEEPLQGANSVTVWHFRNWNINRAVILLPYKGKESDLPGFIDKIKMSLGKKIGYTFFLYPLGMQIVISGENILGNSADWKKCIDLIDTQTALIQSIFIVDFAANKYDSARTWGQYVTGKYQDAIEKAIREYFEK